VGNWARSQAARTASIESLSKRQKQASSELTNDAPAKRTLTPSVRHLVLNGGFVELPPLTERATGVPFPMLDHASCTLGFDRNELGALFSSYHRTEARSRPYVPA
jgi:hypothetical protein